MAVLEWDKAGERTYQIGVDRGVLYLKTGTVVPWNGLTSMEDNTGSELKSYHLDGIKILDHVVPGDFEGKLSAITYPDEFNEVLGVRPLVPGLFFHEQVPKSFHLSYRTRIGNDLDENHGYKIHLLYNLLAFSDNEAFESITDDPSVTEFSWTLSGSPTISTIETIDGVRPTVHISVDSRDADPDILQQLEDILYGTDTTEPRFPTVLELRIMFGEVGGLYIVDNGNGTWTAIDASDDYIESVVDGLFTIDHADVTYLDADTYTITDTPFPLP